MLEFYEDDAGWIEDEIDLFQPSYPVVANYIQPLPFERDTSFWQFDELLDEESWQLQESYPVVANYIQPLPFERDTYFWQFDEDPDHELWLFQEYAPVVADYFQPFPPDNEFLIFDEFFDDEWQHEGYVTDNWLRLWPNDPVPGVITNADVTQTETGLIFFSDFPGFIYGASWYKGTTDTGSHTITLWDGTSHAVLAQVVASGETATGWQTTLLANPFPIAPAKNYVISCHHPVGGFALTTSYFSTLGFDNAPLHAPKTGNGPFLQPAASVLFPTSALGHNYWIDPLFVYSFLDVKQDTPELGFFDDDLEDDWDGSHYQQVDATQQPTNAYEELGWDDDLDGDDWQDENYPLIDNPQSPYQPNDEWDWDNEFVDNDWIADDYQPITAQQIVSVTFDDPFDWEDPVDDDIVDDGYLNQFVAQAQSQITDDQFYSDEFIEDDWQAAEEFQNNQTQPTQPNEEWDWDGDFVEDEVWTDDYLNINPAPPQATQSNEEWDWDGDIVEDEWFGAYETLDYQNQDNNPTIPVIFGGHSGLRKKEKRTYRRDDLRKEIESLIDGEIIEPEIVDELTKKAEKIFVAQPKQDMTALLLAINETQIEIYRLMSESEDDDYLLLLS